MLIPVSIEAMAGPEGFEPPLLVLETSVLPLNYGPMPELLGLLVNSHLHAEPTIFVQLQLVGCVQAVATRVVAMPVAFIALQGRRDALLTFLLSHVCSPLAIGIIWRTLLENLRDQSGADRTATLTNCETHAVFKRNRLDQSCREVNFIAGHDHLNTLGKFD